MKITPKPTAPGQVGSPAVNRTSLTMNTGSIKSPTMQKLDSIKQRFSLPSPAPLNKQGEAIPPQPSGITPNVENKPISTLLDTSEASKAPAEATTSPQDPQLQLLARQQRALRKAQQDLKTAQDAWKQEQAKYVPLDKLRTEPLKALSEAGISQDRLVELQLNQGNPPSESELLKAKIAELETKLNGVDETFKSRDKQAYDNAVRTIQRDAELLVNSDPAYETIKALGAEGTNEVVELIKKQFALDGTILDVEDAAKQIEELAAEREYQRVQKFTQLPKLKQKLSPPAPAPSASEGEEAKQSPSSQTTPPTLTNQMGVSRPLTARERAILAFNQAAKKQSL